jgi:hypothetical protein
MKLIKPLLLMLIVCAFAFSACKKSSTPKPAATGMSLKFNGTAENATVVVAVYDQSQGVLQVTGTLGTTAALSIAVTNAKVGSFDIASGAASTIYATGPSLQTSYIGSTGTVVITALSSTSVSGTFQFTGIDLSNVTATITSGQFQAAVTQ